MIAFYQVHHHGNWWCRTNLLRSSLFSRLQINRFQKYQADLWKIMPAFLKISESSEVRGSEVFVFIWRESVRNLDSERKLYFGFLHVCVITVLILYYHYSNLDMWITSISKLMSITPILIGPHPVSPWRRSVCRLLYLPHSDKMDGERKSALFLYLLSLILQSFSKLDQESD